MKCRCESQGNCVGPMSTYMGGGVELCRYHGELVNKLQQCTLSELEYFTRTVKRYGGFSTYPVEQGRRLALCCSGDKEFKTNFRSVCDRTYSYTNHQ